MSASNILRENAYGDISGTYGYSLLDDMIDGYGISMDIANMPDDIAIGKTFVLSVEPSATTMLFPIKEINATEDWSDMQFVLADISYEDSLYIATITKVLDVYLK